MDDELEDIDYDIDLGNEDEDALLADDYQDSGRYDQSAEDVLDLNPENDLECELSTPNVSKQYDADPESSFDRTQEEEQDTNRQENFETSHEDNSFNALHDESDDEDKDNSNRDRFKSERSQILPPTSSNTIPDSLENVVTRNPPQGAPRDRWQHGRRGKRGLGGRPMGQIRPSFRPPFTPPYQNRGNQNQRAGHRPRFQHRGGNNGGPNVPNTPASKKILINPHFQGAVQPLPGSGRLVWDTALQEPPMNTFQPPAVDHFQHTRREPRPLQGRPDELAPWSYQEQTLPSPWLEGFGPGSEPNPQAQQFQQQQQHHHQSNQHHHQNNQHHHQQDMRHQQPNAFAVQPFQQPTFNPQPFGSNEMEMEQVRFQEQRRIHHELQHQSQLDEDRQRELDFQNRWGEKQRHEMMQMEDLMAPPAQNYDRQAVYPRNPNTYDRHERGMQEGPGRNFSAQPQFSAPPPPNPDFYQGPSGSSCDSSELSSFPSPARHQLPPFFSQPPPMLPQPQHIQASSVLNNPPPMHCQGPPGFDRPQKLNNQGPAMHNKPPGFHHRPHPYQNPSHSSLSDDRTAPFRSQVAPSTYQTPVGSHMSHSQPDFSARQTISRPILHESPPQQMPKSLFVQPIRNVSQTNQGTSQQMMQNHKRVEQGGRQAMQARPAAATVQRAEPNRRVVLPNNLQQVRLDNQSLQTNLHQVRLIDTTQAPVQRTRPYQDKESRAPRQPITTQNKAAPQNRPQIPLIRPQLSSTRQPGPSNHQPDPSIHQKGPTSGQPGPGIRQLRPPARQQGHSVAQPGLSNRQQGPSIRLNGPPIRPQGPSIRQQAPSNRPQGTSVPGLKAGPALRLISAVKRQQASAEVDTKRAKLNVQELYEEEVDDEYLEEAVDDEEDAELRNYRKQIAQQKKIRDAVLLAKETRRQQLAMERMLAQEQKQSENLQDADQGVVPVGEAIATIVNRNPVEPHLPLTPRRVVNLCQKVHPRR